MLFLTHLYKYNYVAMGFSFNNKLYNEYFNRTNKTQN